MPLSLKFASTVKYSNAAMWLQTSPNLKFKWYSNKKYITDTKLCYNQKYSQSVWLDHDLEKGPTKEEEGDPWLIVNASLSPSRL
jgi:hypothetical protein